MNPVSELLLRSRERFAGRRLLLIGDFLDESLLSLAAGAAAAAVIVDNYLSAQALAAALGKSLTREIDQTVRHRGITLRYAPVEHCLDEGRDFDALALVLSKQKQQTRKILSLLSPALRPGALIYVAGENSGGGRSAGRLLAPAGRPVKLDTARKCTLFAAAYGRPFAPYVRPAELELRLLGQPLVLRQDPLIFAAGRLDEGTALLLEALENCTQRGSALDLGCGSGVTGLFLSRLGFESVTSSDISAAALNLARANAALNRIGNISYLSADMLNGLGSFDLIAVNPPFHSGLKSVTAPALSMIRSAGEHLNPGGALYLVCNAHLPYEEAFRHSFKAVEIVRATSRYRVFRAGG